MGGFWWGFGVVGFIQAGTYRCERGGDSGDVDGECFIDRWISMPKSVAVMACQFIFSR